ncbi:C39 family peptidase [Rhizomonospora bruguierae]|uniref:C39 family peptidase n=1 Tax=Rhizomonospora bruguierae TaxID=1581705 RepID=UPI0020C17CB2|nr:C39 family peptidase [Micromonospora sp. NBRC 107566]
MNAIRTLRDALEGNRLKVAATAAGLLSVFSLGAIADVTRGQTAPPVGGDTSIAAMTLDRIERPAERAQRPAPVAKQLKYDYQAQINGWYCGPGATRIAVSSRGYFPDQETVAGRLGTTVNGTDSIDDVTRVLNMYGTDRYGSRHIGPRASQSDTERMRDDVVQSITSGFPVVANIAGAASDVDGVVHDYPGGHYLTIVGYRDNGNQVRIADPAYVNGQASYWMDYSAAAQWTQTRGYSAL